jgi:hypothetical protein
MVKLIIWVVIGLLALSFFGISLRAVVESPQAQDNFQFLAQLLTHGWNYIVAWFTNTWSSVKEMVHLPDFNFKH